jgi:hypothetical protein
VTGAPPSRVGAGGPKLTHGRVITRRPPDAVLVLPVDHDATDPVVLSGTGVALWDAFGEPASMATVAQRLAAQYSTDIDEVARALGPVVDELVARGALVEAP